MAKKKKKNKKPGSPPGSLVFTGEKLAEKSIVLEVKYYGDSISMKSLQNGEMPSIEAPSVTWCDIRGLHDVEFIENFGKNFNIHPLVLEDILNTQQRPKFEEYGEEVFMVLTALDYRQDTHSLETEQIALYFGKNFLFTFQENPDDTFTAVRERLEAGKGRIRLRNSDYLAYALTDNVVDHYFVMLDHLEERLDSLETEINKNPSKATKGKIHQLKYQLLTLRKSIFPLREAVNRFTRAESSVVDESTGVFVQDLYDHVIRISDMVDTYRDMANGLQELYLSELSHRMNNVIQVLTIITTLFVPLTFLAGIYGMNFVNIPELRNPYGYFYLLGAMGVITLGLLFFFRKKRWL